MTAPGANGGRPRVLVVGASGGIGHAIVEQYLTRHPEIQIVATTRSAAPSFSQEIPLLTMDVTEEASIAHAADHVRNILGGVDVVIAATGALHHSDGSRPEKAIRELDPVNMLDMFSTNTIGPALLLKHMIPLLARDRRSVFAALSARVGSIEDNALGGWYSYRASKAALNMILRTGAIELARTNPTAVCVGLHPGTVETPLSAPFRNRAQAAGVFSPDQAAGHIVDILENVGPERSGQLIAWDGTRIPF